MKKRLLAAALLLATAAPAFATPEQDFHKLLADHWAWYLRTHPVEATALGVRDYDNLIQDISLEEADREAQQAQAFLDRLKAIPDAGLSPADRVNKAILARLLSEQVEGN